MILAAALLTQLLAQAPAAAPIDHHNRLLLARARAQGKADGIVLVLTREGAVASVMERLDSVGAELQARFDEVGYLRVRLPLARLAALRALPGVLDAQIDGGNLSYGYDQGTDPEAVERLTHFWGRVFPQPDTTSRPPVPAAARGRVGEPNPYVPMSDMGVTRFAREHPTYDGRGVTIAVQERWVLDVAHPTLQYARTLAGDSVGKIIGIISPSSFNPDRDLARFGTLLSADTLAERSRVQGTGPIEAGDSFVALGQWYRAPRPGRYRFGTYTGHPFDAPNAHAVIWDSAGQVWVDTDRDRDFRDETPLGDFNLTRSVGFLTADSAGAGPAAGRPTSFAVMFDSSGAAVRLYPGVQDHQTMVASVAAGRGILGGTDAGAPAAQLVVVDAGWSLGDALEGFIRAARDPRVDLITYSQTGERFPSAGGSIVGRLLERVVAHYGKPIFAAANNSGPILGLPIEPSTSPGVISVGAYAGRDTYRAHYGWNLEARDWIVGYSARGPARNGGMKPDLLAPALSIAGSPCSAGDQWQPGVLYSLPPCYMLGGGTSAATPHAAGAAAALISAAKQAGIQWDARRIAWALREGARTLSGYGVHEQGAGLVDVRRSWDLLRKRIDVPVIEVRAPVRHALDRYIDQPGSGPGLYEREGWAPGDSGTRIITLTRTSGSSEPTSYDLRWRGNDGTFSLTTSRIVLPLGQPVEVPVRIQPREAGAHSAAFQIVDRPRRVAVHQVLLTVVAAHQLTAANGYTVRVKGGAVWPREVPFFVNVPAGTAALRVQLKVHRGRVVLREDDSSTREDLDWGSYFKPYRYPLRRVAPVVAGDSGVKIVASPAAGVWEFSVEPPWRFDAAVEHRIPSDVELSVTALGVDPDPRPTRDSAVVTIGMRSRLGAPTHPETVAELGARRSLVGSPDSTGAGPLYDIDVPPGTTTLRVAVRPEGTADADLDLYLFDCTSGECFLWDQVIGGDGGDLLVRSPPSGPWKAVIDPVGGSAAGSFRYTDVVTSAGYGLVRGLGPGSVRMVRTGALPIGREPVLVVDVVDQGLEMEEQARPLAEFAGRPYRPVPLGTAMVPLARD